MATFPSITPAYGIQKSSAPATRKVQFGDGYEKQNFDGPESKPKNFQSHFQCFGN